MSLNLHGQLGGEMITSGIVSDSANLLMLTDKTIYSGEDIISFSAFFSTPVETVQNSGNILVVVLVDDSNKLLLSSNFRLDGNQVSGSIKMPGNYKTGFFRLIGFISVLEEGNIFYYQKLLCLIDPDDQQRVEEDKSGSDFAGANTYQNQGNCINVNSEYSVQIRNFRQTVPVRSRIDFDLSIARENAMPFKGKLTACINSSQVSNLFRGDILEFDETEYYSNTGVIKVDAVPSEKILNVSLLQKNGVGANYLLGWIVPEDSLFRGDLITGFTGEVGWFIRQYISGRSFLLVDLPANPGNMDLVMKLEGQRSDMSFQFIPATGASIITEIPEIRPPHQSVALINSFIEMNNDRSKILRTYRSWGVDLLEAEYNTGIQTSPNREHAYGDPDILYHPEDFEASPDVESFIRDHVPQVKFKGKSNKTRLVITPMYRKDIARTRDAQVLLNNIPISDLDNLRNVPLHMLKRIDIVLNPVIFNGYYSTGIIAFYLKDDIDVKTFLSPEIQIFDIVDQRSEARISNHVKDDLPDIRNTIFWETDLVPDKYGNCAIEFLTPDLPGRYLISIAGVSVDGKMLVMEKEFLVE